MELTPIRSHKTHKLHLAHLQDNQEAQEHAQDVFNQVCGNSARARLRVYDASADAIITALGHAHDIVIVERVSDVEGPEASNLNCALFNTGRPVLVAPGTRISEPFSRPVISSRVKVSGVSGRLCFFSSSGNGGGSTVWIA